jgi:hypothetical protein
MLRTFIIIAAAAVALPTAAFATRADADACAKDLRGETLKAYRAGVGLAERGATLEQAIQPHLQRLHAAGRVTEQQARQIGTDAAKCIRLVHRD